MLCEIKGNTITTNHFKTQIQSLWICSSNFIRIGLQIQCSIVPNKRKLEFIKLLLSVCVKKYSSIVSVIQILVSVEEQKKFGMHVDYYRYNINVVEKFNWTQPSLSLKLISIKSHLFVQFFFVWFCIDINLSGFFFASPTFHSFRFLLYIHETNEIE